jgi:hypothetical protein
VPQQQPQQPYDDRYYAPDGGAPLHGGYAVNGGYPQEQGYAEPARDGGVSPGGAGTYASSYQEQPYSGDWQQRDGYQNGYPNQYPSDAPEAESAQAGDSREQDHVGFDRPGPAPSAVHELTDAGLPRRGPTASGTTGTDGTRQANREPSAPAEGNGDSGWRSANDERWQQASQLRKPKAGGVTSSGLPRRVPKANLVEGTADTTPQGGPQVSRAPEDVRGRLSNLRRGVQRGRSAGSETNGQGFGPDSTYDQER